MTETLKDLKLQFKQNQTYEKRMLEKALGITITEVIEAVPLDEKALFKKVTGRKR